MSVSPTMEPAAKSIVKPCGVRKPGEDGPEGVQHDCDKVETYNHADEHAETMAPRTDNHAIHLLVLGFEEDADGGLLYSGP